MAWIVLESYRYFFGKIINFIYSFLKKKALHTTQIILYKMSTQPTKKKRMRTCMETIHRILHDPSLPSHCFSFGYLDRFIGIIERRVDSADWSDIASLDLRTTMAVPKHRIQYIQCNGVIVWDKRPESRTDLFWEGSGIQQVLHEQMVEGLWSESQKDDEVEENGKKEMTSAAGAGAAGAGAGAGAGAEKTNDDRRGTRRPRGSDLRPNYFICVRIESEVGRRKIAKLQHHVCEEAKESSGGSVTQLNEVRQTM